jgi:hypothetical protein
MANRATQRLKDYAAARSLQLDGLADHCRVPRDTLIGWLYRGKRPRAVKMADLDRRGIVAVGEWYAEPANSDVVAVS